jgi:hypothetical protein
MVREAERASESKDPWHLCRASPLWIFCQRRNCGQPRSCLTLRKLVSFQQAYAAPDGHIHVALRARGKSSSRRAGGPVCSAPCLLPPQGSPSLPRFADLGIRTACNPRRQLLQPKLPPRCDYHAVGSSTGASGCVLPANHHRQPGQNASQLAGQPHRRIQTFTSPARLLKPPSLT